MNQQNFYDAGFKVFGLYGATNGLCGCGYDKCEAYFKHPISSNWQHTPHWSQEQFETMHEMGQFDTGFGILCDGYLVIDVDERNGGIDSFQDLCRDLSLDLFSMAGLVVATGSGGGSMHLFFKLEENTALMGHHKDYVGIDFKSSGFVVGAGSIHKSGNKYEVMKGDPSDIVFTPSALLRLLKKPDTHRVKTSLGTVDMTTQELVDILAYIDPDCDYEQWVRCGMAIHDATNGTGLELWDDWSKNGKKYEGYETLNKRWHNFGKSASPVSAGTLIFYAEENGYKQEVTFENTQVFEDEPGSETVDVSGIDLKRPPGFVGELTDWINNQCLYPRESLAVAAALTAVGSIAGMRCKDGKDGFSSNVFSFCVAGSATGKESIMTSYGEIIKAAGVSRALYGSIKSEQEIIRNLTREQAAFYSIDEFGLVLRKIMNAGKGGGNGYLEGIIGTLMSTYTKAHSFLPISGDMKHTLKDELRQSLAKARKKVDENEDKMGLFAASIPSIENSLLNIDDGIVKPFLSMLGFTTPVTFNSLMDYENATNGFLSRAMIFEETDNNPRGKRGFKKQPMTDGMAQRIANLYAPGCSSATGVQRVEFIGEQEQIKTDSAGDKLLDEIKEHFWQMGEELEDGSGLTAVARRGYEIVAKVSLILAIPSGLRTPEHIRWAFALAKRDIERKIKLAFANMSEKDSPSESIATKIHSFLTQSEDPQTEGVIVNRCRPHKKPDVQKVIAALVASGKLQKTEQDGRKAARYHIA